MSKSNHLLLYERLHFASTSLTLARHHAAFLLKKKWHFGEFEKRRRQATIAHQSGMTTALVIAYTRPFTGSKGGWPRFPASLLPYDAQELRLHRLMIDRRNDVFAHTSGERHSAYPRYLAGIGTVLSIQGIELVLPRDQLEQLVGMISKVLDRLAVRRNELEREIYLEASAMALS